MVSSPEIVGPKFVSDEIRFYAFELFLHRQDFHFKMLAGQGGEPLFVLFTQTLVQDYQMVVIDVCSTVLYNGTEGNGESGRIVIVYGKEDGNSHFVHILIHCVIF